ncbi:MAG: phosphoenolpyruvate carboxykinase, partial [Planctomycetes bacterium]|nr:phosphoenolpyruvate carboxykinase [Planctomycetota bacterium]
FANPFRVYELWKDVESFAKVFENGAVCYCFNSVGLWKSSDEELNKIPLQTSLTLQTCILTDQLQWEAWDLLPGSEIPTKASIEAHLPGFYDTYNPAKVENLDAYLELFKDRFEQRRDFLQNSDLQEKPELLSKLIAALKIKA